MASAPSTNFLDARAIGATCRKLQPPSALRVFPELHARRCNGRVLTASAIHCDRLTADVRPSIDARFVAASEALLGYIWMAFFIGTFAVLFKQPAEEASRF